jgi:hypothetical protein
MFGAIGAFLWHLMADRSRLASVAGRLLSVVLRIWKLESIGTDLESEKLAEICKTASCYDKQWILVQAIRSQNKELMVHAINMGAALNKGPYNPLIEAIAVVWEDGVKTLTEHGADWKSNHIGVRPIEYVGDEIQKSCTRVEALSNLAKLTITSDDADDDYFDYISDKIDLNGLVGEFDYAESKPDDELDHVDYSIETVQSDSDGESDDLEDYANTSNNESCDLTDYWESEMVEEEV